MTPARATIALGFIGLLLAGPATAQTSAPGAAPEEPDVQRGFQIPGLYITPPRSVPPRMRMERRDQSSPPARTEDGAASPAEGCNYQGNKLDLIV